MAKDKMGFKASQHQEPEVWKPLRKLTHSDVQMLVLQEKEIALLSLHSAAKQALGF